MDSSNTYFTARLVGSAGHEILNPDGEVVAWTVDGRWAAVVTALLNAGEVLPGLATVQATGEADDAG
jgi:hypothetical protein